MSNENVDWTTFRKRIFILKPLDEVYSAWATKAKIEQWFLERADLHDQNGSKRRPDEPVQTRDSFIWKWHNWDFNEKGTILVANNKDTLSFTFGTGGEVHISLLGTNIRTEIVLVQDQIPADEKSKLEIFTGCSAGWTFWRAIVITWLISWKHNKFSTVGENR